MAPSWLHGDVARADAEALLGTDDGSFLVRARKSKGKAVDGEYVLSVVYKEKPTHHSVKTGDDGILTINGKPHGKKSSIEDLVQYLGQKRKGWPVALDKPIASGTPSAPSVETPAAAPVPAAPVAEPAAESPATTAPAGTADPSTDPTTPSPGTTNAGSSGAPEATQPAGEAPTVSSAAVEEQPVVPQITVQTIPSSAPRKSELWGKYPANTAAPPEAEAAGTQSPASIALAQSISGHPGYSSPSRGTPPVQRKKLTTMRGNARTRQPSPPPPTSNSAVPWSSVALKATKAPGATPPQTDTPPQPDTPTQVETPAAIPTFAPVAPMSLEESAAAASPAQGLQVARVDNWGSKVPQHKIRVYEVLRKLFSEVEGDDAEAKKLYLSRGDLETRITIDELEHVLEGVGAFDPNDGAYKLLDIFLRCNPGEDGTTSLGEFLARCDPAQARAAREKAQREREALAARLLQQQQEQAARDAALIEAERRATETAIANARLEEVAKQRELQEKLYREELARIDDMRRAEVARIAQEQAEYQRQQEEAIAREKELKQRRMREKHERWKARQMPMPWELPAETEMV
eukprot:m.12270 g.12270  ORF g.12270 m.12270 type:complete len:577 (+) comp9621_c0_seq2:304-2034(+)